MPDVIESTATQVRVLGSSAIHRLKGAETRGRARAYWTACGHMWFGHEGAVLTTRPADCALCGWAS